MKGFVHSTRFRPALVLLKVGLELLPGFHLVCQKLWPRPEGEPADIAIGQARRGPGEPRNLEIPFRHMAIIAGRNF